MRYRHVMAVNRVLVQVLVRPFLHLIQRLVVGNDLVPVKVEVNPRVRASAFSTSQQTTIETTRGIEIVHRKSEVKRAKL